MESHNHPSYIEPYQGAATGVGGILRDVFTMGARPIACLNALSLRRTRRIRRRAIWSPAWSPASAATAIPSACRRSAAQVRFHTRYDGNILVNAMAVGLADDRQDLLRGGVRRRHADRLSRLQDRPRRHPRRHHGVGRVRRRRRGEAPDRAGRRSVRGEAPARSLPRDHGEGLRRSPSRTWARPGSPARRSRWAPRAISASTLDLDKVPCRETGMSAYEMMLSESQERMLMVLKPEKEAGGRGDLPQMGARLRHRRPHHADQALHRASTAAR